ncbi:MAG: tRNA (adenosine(37)-N6)-threonylcarbamoyltransferase complex ATPase subunit type 1 TsaE [bacterium]|jgi:tRNA threonylcarbamoyladenosine biosynthesis protein TsaE|nr:tRNA (adenosine(37)-N6)-threonylcarbamoyltransferase complex ATPase subunit type 1 TsaE [bacterium]
MDLPLPTGGRLSPPILLPDLAATRAAGALLARGLSGGELILLEGPLGAGKTSLVQGLAAELDVSGDVTSPTFALCNRLAGRLELHHYDLYRMDTLDRLRRIGFEESLESGAVVLVEWPALALPLLRGEVLLVRLDHAGEVRQLRWGRLPIGALAAQEFCPPT